MSKFVRGRRSIGGLLILLGGVTGLTLLAPMASNAQTGSVSDANDTAETIDAKTLTHADNAGTLTYTMEAFENWNEESAYELRWNFELDGEDLGGQSDAVLFLRRNGLDGELAGSVWNGTNSADIIGDATVSKSGAVVTASFPLSFFTEEATAGLGDATSYAYNFSVIHQTETGVTDFVPDVGQADAVHLLGAAATTTTTTAPGSTTTTTSPATTTTSTTVPGSTTTTTSTSTTVAPATTTTTRPTTTTRVLTVSTMPRTGAPGSTQPMVALSAALILVGAVLVGAGKRPDGNYFI